MRRIVALVAMLTSLLWAAPAVAESGETALDRGDAAPAIDMTHLWASNGRHRVTMKVEVPDLGPAASFNFLVERQWDGLSVDVSRRHHHVRTVVRHFQEDTAPRVSCDGARTRWSKRHHVVKVSVPQSCYPFHTPPKWTFMVSARRGDGADDADYDYGRSITLERG